MDIFDAAGDEEGEVGLASDDQPRADLSAQGTTLSLPAVRRQLGRFERLVAKNAEQRGKFPDDPSK